MLRHPLFYCVVSGFLFGAWPMISRSASLNPSQLITAIAVGTLAVSLVGGAVTSTFTGVVTTKGLIVGLFCGILNGVGALAYAKLIGWEGKNITSLIPIAAIIIPVAAVIVGTVMYREPVTMNKIMGILLAVGAIYMLNK